MTPKKMRFGLFIILMWFLTSCNLIGDAVVTASEQILSPLPPIAEDASEESSIPMPTITPTFQSVIYDNGPWFLYLGSDVTGEEYLQHLLIVNWDGTALTSLIPDLFAWQVEVQPASDGKSGQYAAVVVSNEYNDLNYRLLILHLPEGEIIEDIPLTPPVPTRDVSFLLANWDTLSWSPDGQKLAFSGVAEGDRLDVFVYSLMDGDNTRLTNQQHAGNAASMRWSPDGQYIAYESSRYQQIGLLPAVDSIWLTRAVGSETRMLTSDENWVSDWCFGVYIDQWLSDTRLTVNCPSSTLEAITLLTEFNIKTGTSTPVYPDDQSTYWSAVYAPEIQNWLIAFTENSTSQRAGNMYFFGGEEWQLAGPADSPLITWWPEKKVFITSRGLLNPDGDLEEIGLPPFDTLISPDNYYWAFPVSYKRGSASLGCYWYLKQIDSFWIGRAGEIPSLVQRPFQVVEWSTNSQSVFLQDREQTSQYIAIAPDFEPQLISSYTGDIFGPWDGQYPLAP